uniref:Cytochrome c oxidase assembly factor 4 homolog, mitochondrial-like n=1 Tax=Dermatophagoides pteronyssinus TaxID=6956 RepID=A0A6P6YAI8_DERPT|nr:cytochrome c oxidase assembly factor 4 homolog, mitochondrial-like [Dermatophagoides pteronyssinus]
MSSPILADTNTEEKDPIEEMLDRTGCKKTHISLQECMYEHKDWRKCQHLVNELRDCMLEYEKQKRPEFQNIDGEK